VPLPFDPIAEASENWKRKGWGSVDAMAAATSITRAHQILVSRIDAVLKPVGLNFSRFEALALLYLSRKGEMPLGKVGERLQVHPASVTNTIDRLQSDGKSRPRVPGSSMLRTSFSGRSSSVWPACRAPIIERQRARCTASEPMKVTSDAQ